MLRSVFHLTAVMLSLFFLSTVVGASPQENLRVEGIVFEEETPEKSLAVINGEFVQAGDQYEGYEIVKIGPARVDVRHLASGKDKTLWIKGGKPKKEAAVSQVPQEKSSKEAPGKDESSGLLEKATAKFGGVMNLAYETQAVAEMRNISSSATVYGMTRGTSGRLTIGKLVDDGVLAGFSEGGVKGIYRYRIESMGSAVSVYADPVDEDSTMKHFFIDSKGNLYSETGKPASRQSKPHQPTIPTGMTGPAGMTGLPSELME